MRSITLATKLSKLTYNGSQLGEVAKPMLVAVVDRQVRQLSDMQLELMQQEAISIEDYNEISELIGNLKEYMINCRSYNGN